MVSLAKTKKIASFLFRNASINVKIPLKTFCCVTGVSGSGKSTLVTDILHRSLVKSLYGSQEIPGEHDKIVGAQHIDKVIEIDQSPIGRTPRSNPATYTKAFDLIRTLFAQTNVFRNRNRRHCLYHAGNDTGKISGYPHPCSLVPYVLH